MAAKLRGWFTAATFSVSNNGLSRMLVPLIHRGLRRNRIRLAHQVTVAPRWGGAIVEAEWSQVCDTVGLQPQWEAARASPARCRTGGANAAAS